ncbi:hypothetical protein N7445_000580 [Penicillium cf. griseofulvum]|nr:hypothetical protein N7445_000580 [Penicillium cf. griseofulvum]
MCCPRPRMEPTVSTLHLLLSNWPTASPKSTFVLRPLVLVWQSEKKLENGKKEEEKTLPQRTLACSRQAHDAKSRLTFLIVGSIIAKVAGAAVTTITNPQNLTFLFITHDFGLYPWSFCFMLGICVSR